MSNNDEPLTPLLDASDVRRLLKISPSGVWRLMHSGELPSVKVGARVLVDPADLRRFIDDRKSSRDENDPVDAGSFDERSAGAGGGVERA